MFRRARRTMRGFGPARRGGGPQIPPELQHVRQLMDEGEYGEASHVFHGLAKGAEDPFPERAPFFYFEAGRAAILSGETRTGVAHFRSGLTLLGSQQRHQRVRRAGRHIVDELRERGLNAEADEIESVIGNNLPAQAENEGVNSEMRASLPDHCPSCGAAVRPDEVEWLDDDTAGCDYCGSPIRAES